MDDRGEQTDGCKPPALNAPKPDGGLEVNHRVGRPSTLLLTLALVVLAPLLVVCVALAAAGELGRWSVFWAGPPARNSLNAERYDRWETHFMMGEGIVAIRRYSVFSQQPFDFAGATTNSKELSWATMGDWPGGPPRVRVDWSLSRPNIVLPAWPLGVAAVCVCGVPIAWAWRRRRAVVRDLQLQCRGCAYDLRGLPGASVCPECARPISKWAREQVALQGQSGLLVGVDSRND